MRVKLIDVDSHNGWPNLALMKLKALHNKQGDECGFDTPNPDKVYISCIFTENKAKALGLAKFWGLFDAEVEIGGCGVNGKKLPLEVEHTCPDYDLYNVDFSLGFCSRGCIRKCPWCDIWKREGNIKVHSPLDEFLRHKQVVLLDNNLLASPNAMDILYELMSLSRTQKLKVCFNQGLDIRLINDEVAKYLADTDFRALNFSNKRLYFAWDDLKLCPERKVVSGIEILREVGIKPYRLMFYMLVGYRHPTLCYEDVYRFKRLLEFGVDPFVMLYNNCKDGVLRKFARYVDQRIYKGRWSYREDLHEIEGVIEEIWKRGG